MFGIKIKNLRFEKAYIHITKINRFTRVKILILLRRGLLKDLETLAMIRKTSLNQILKRNFDSKSLTVNIRSEYPKFDIQTNL